MDTKLNSYVLFPSHNDGLALEKVLKDENIKYTIVPTPRQLSTCCGISIMIDPNDKVNVEKLIDSNPDIKTEGIHTIKRKKRNWFG
ncbi:DUF3343 domain-containing protein [Dethiothermospora halolimnae]|uniref:DUF3343 domain-containing protein n=1 Tax=Dethiothermospora halolimnae TaxID=3114390 RepID=UPI003CCBA3F8